MAENNGGNTPDAPCCPYPTCGCIGYAYVPVQELGYVYETDKALASGTIFPELDLKMGEYGTVCKMWGGKVCG